jgi:hypothetical protein
MVSRVHDLPAARSAGLDSGAEKAQSRAKPLINSETVRYRLAENLVAGMQRARQFRGVFGEIFGFENRGLAN